MTELRFARNCSRLDDVHLHLTACDAAFTPRLGARVAIRDYAAKLTSRAERFEAWSDVSLVGLIAVYCNETERAFVTSLSVLPERTRGGIGRRLMAAAIAHVRGHGFRRLALDVDRRAAALDFYMGLGFSTEARTGNTLHLSLDLGRPTGAVVASTQSAERHVISEEANP